MRIQNMVFEQQANAPSFQKSAVKQTTDDHERSTIHREQELRQAIWNMEQKQLEVKKHTNSKDISQFYTERNISAKPVSMVSKAIQTVPFKSSELNLDSMCRVFVADVLSKFSTTGSDFTLPSKPN